MGRPKLCSCHCGEPIPPPPFNTRLDHVLGFSMWRRSGGTYDTVDAVDVAIDSEGNVLTAGAVSLSPGGDNLIKSEPNGSVLWRYRHGIPSLVGGTLTSVAVDAEDNIYIGGTPVAFNNTTFLKKLAPDGTVLATASSPSQVGPVTCNRLVVPGDGSLYAIEHLQGDPNAVRPSRLTQRSLTTLAIVRETRLNSLSSFNQFGMDVGDDFIHPNSFFAMTAAADGKVYAVVMLDSEEPGSVQKVRIVGTPTGGSFKLNFDGQVTAAIAWNATAIQVQSKLLALSNVDAVSVTGGPLPGTPVTVTFGGALATTEILLTAQDVTLGGAGVSITLAGQTDHLVCLAANGGGQLWKADLRIASGSAGAAGGSLAVGEGVLAYCTAQDRCIMRLAIESGETLWMRSFDPNQGGSISCNKIRIGDDGNIWALGQIPDGPAGDICYFTAAGAHHPVVQYRQGWGPAEPAVSVKRPRAIVQRNQRVATVGQLVVPS